jgi:hypothetical protein
LGLSAWAWLHHPTVNAVNQFAEKSGFCFFRTTLFLRCQTLITEADTCLRYPLREFFVRISDTHPLNLDLNIDTSG